MTARTVTFVEGDTTRTVTFDDGTSFTIVFAEPEAEGGGGAPSGPAGGDLTGTFPNPTLSTAKQAELDAKVPASLFDAHSIVAADADNTPTARTIDEDTLVGRLAGGSIGKLTVAQVRTLLAVYTAAQTDTAIANAVAALISSAPGALDTLDELAAALGDDANFASTITTLIGTKQPLDATLTAFAALIGVADRAIYFTGDDTFSLFALTAFGRSLVDDADAATARTTLGAVLLVGGGHAGNSNVTKYFGISTGATITTEANARTPVPLACTLTKVLVEAGTAPGAGKSWSVKVLKNGVATSMVGTIADSATSVTITANPQTFAEGDFISIEMEAVSSPATGFARWSGVLTY